MDGKGQFLPIIDEMSNDVDGLKFRYP